MVGETLGRSRIVEQIGEGGMGEVYQATDAKLCRQLFLDSQLDESGGNRCLR